MPAIISLSHGPVGSEQAVVIKGSLRVLLLGEIAAVDDAIVHELEQSVQRLSVERVTTEGEFDAGLRSFAPDVVLAGLTADGFSPGGVLRAMRAARPAVPVIIVAEALDERSALHGLRGGADDVVLTANLSRLAPAISSALALRRPLTRLSPRQLEVLRMVAEGRSTRDIAERLSLSMKTVESHRGAVMKRLELHNVADLVRYAVHTGMVSADVRGTPRGSRRSPISTPRPDETRLGEP